MKRATITLCLAFAAVASLPVQAADSEEGFFGRTWRGFKSVVGLGEEQREQHEERKYQDDDEERAHARPDKSKYKGNRHETPDLDDVRSEGRFSAEQARLIRESLGMPAEVSDVRDKGKKPKKLPPGLKKKLERGGELPPGWKMKFERGEVVSDEVWAQAHALPADLSSRLGTVAGTELIQVDDRVARVLSSTREILDVIDLVTGP